MDPSSEIRVSKGLKPQLQWNTSVLYLHLSWIGRSICWMAGWSRSTYLEITWKEKEVLIAVSSEPVFLSWREVSGWALLGCHFLRPGCGSWAKGEELVRQAGSESSELLGHWLSCYFRLCYKFWDCNYSFFCHFCQCHHLCPFKVPLESIRVQRCYFLWFLCQATSSACYFYIYYGSLKFFISFPTRLQIPSLFFPPGVVAKRVKATMQALLVGVGNGKEHHHWYCLLVPERKVGWGSIEQRACLEVAVWRYVVFLWGE